MNTKRKPLSDISKQALKHPWVFKKYLRASAFGWRGSSLAVKRLSEAVSEIKSVARKEPVAAAEGVVQLCERIWPALEYIDTSSGALGTAVNHTLDTLMPVLTGSSAETALRQKWLDRLFEAILEDGVDYLMIVQNHWVKVCGDLDLVNYWADYTLPMLREAWSDISGHGYFTATDICLSCLLEADRHKELRDVLSLQNHRWWHYDRYWAQALLKQGKLDEAIQYAETLVNGKANSDDSSIWQFCEQALIDAGRIDEAYQRYALLGSVETTYINHFRSIKKRYPNKDPRQILTDLIGRSENKSVWFASARQSGYLDIALDCAKDGFVEVRTLIRAARETAERNPEFSQTIALKAIEMMLHGYGWEITASDVEAAFDHLMTAARNAGDMTHAVGSLHHLLGPETNHQSEYVKTILEGLMKRTDQEAQ